MKLLVCVLNETQRLNDLLQAMAELGLSGATVLESQGMAKFLAKEAPVIAGLRHLVTQGRTFNYTILSVVEDDAVADRTMKAIEDHLLPGTRPGTHGVAFTLPVDKFVRFHPHGPEVRLRDPDAQSPAPEPTPTSLEELETDSFEAVMQAALQEEASQEPGFLVKLLEGLKSFVSESAPGQDLKERRRASRVLCDYRAGLQLEDGNNIEVRVTEIGVLGLTVHGGRELPEGTLVQLCPPQGYDIETTDTICCKIVTSARDDDGFRAGLVYHQPARELSSSWLTQLFRSLGYSIDHLVQRRRLRRIAGTVPATVQVLGEKTFQVASVLDLGIEGALVQVDADWPEGTQLGLKIGPYAAHEQLYLEGITVARRPGDDNHLHGVRFFELESRRLTQLGNLVLELLKKPLPTP